MARPQIVSRRRQIQDLTASPPPCGKWAAANSALTPPGRLYDDTISSRLTQYKDPLTPGGSLPKKVEEGLKSKVQIQKIYFRNKIYWKRSR